MKIIYKTGSLLDASEPVIVHGCNARGVMGSGVAKAIRETYPRAYDKYRQRYHDGDLNLGDAIWVDCGRHIVVNAITQLDFGREPRQYVSYGALIAAFRAINRQVPFEGIERAVAMPLIGCGLGGGQWPLVAAIIETEMTDVQPVVYTLDGIIPE